MVIIKNKKGFKPPEMVIYSTRKERILAFSSQENHQGDYSPWVKPQGTSESWQLGQDRQASGVQNLDPTGPELEKTFLELAEKWRRETRGISSSNKASMHPSYQQIIGMGKAVIPLLLRELERNSGQWFWAIKAISREDPVPPEKRGQTQEMIRYWLEWGKQKGYRW